MGTIPTELGIMSNIELLGLGRNDLTGSIPEEMGNMESLSKHSYCKRRCAFLFCPFYLTLLLIKYIDTFGLENNKLSGTIPSELGNLQQMSKLFVCGTKCIRYT